jgi:hypothetical protein
MGRDEVPCQRVGESGEKQVPADRVIRAPAAQGAGVLLYADDARV